MLMGRQLRRRLSDFAVQPAAEVKKHMQKSRARTSLSVLDRGDIVRILDDAWWTVKATIQDRVDPRFYVLRTEEGRTLRRNRQHIRKTGERFMLRDTAEEYEDNCREWDAGKITANRGLPSTKQCLPPPYKLETRPITEEQWTGAMIQDSVLENRLATSARPLVQLSYAKDFQQFM
ncbi:hypothetical protein MRX96_008479 [Rhipicephalus microplus]